MIIHIPHRNKKGLKGIEICGRLTTIANENDQTIVYEGKNALSFEAEICDYQLD